MKISTNVARDLRAFVAADSRMQTHRLILTIMAVVLLQGVALATGACTGKLSTYLDEGLRRALFSRFLEVNPDPDGTPTCEHIINKLIPVGALAPSLVPTAIEEALSERGAMHHRWYILTNQIVKPAETDDLPRLRDSTLGDKDDLEFVKSHLTDNDFEPDDLILDVQAGVLLVRAQSMKQFSELISDEIRTRITHIMENYPFAPALDGASAEIGLDPGREDTSGDGFAIAIIDTGVDAEYFGNRLIYEACFSSHRYAITNQDETYSTCNDEPNEVHDPNLGDTYAADSAYGDHGGPCKFYQPTGCDHGSNVAYIAAGRGAADGTRGVAPGAGIIAIQVASILPAEYCHEDGSSSTCARPMPFDVLRALQFLEGALDHANRLDKQHLLMLHGDSPKLDWDLVTRYQVSAVNLSFETRMSCAKIGDDAVAERCQEGLENEDPLYEAYENTCYNALSLAIEHLRKHSVYTVVAAGNKKGTVAWGRVSNPACAEFAVTVSSWVHESPTDIPLLYKGSRYAEDLVDFLAPGVSIEFDKKQITGTSFAAPFVAGAIVLVQEGLDSCPRSSNDALALLESHRQKVELGTAAKGKEKSRASLGLNVDFDFCQSN